MQYPEPNDAAAPPPADVVAAFDVEAMGEAYVLTASTYHVLDLADRVWVTSGPLANLLPGLSGTPVYAVSIPASYDGLGATGSERALVTTTAGQTYAFDHMTGTRRWRADRVESCCPASSWAAAGAPSFSDIRAAWFDSNNMRRLYPHHTPLCAAAGGAGTEFAYYALLASPSLHYLESTHCMEFAPPINSTDREPFGGTRVGPGSPLEPNPASVGAMFYHETDRTIWTFTP